MRSDDPTRFTRVAVRPVAVQSITMAVLQEGVWELVWLPVRPWATHTAAGSDRTPMKLWVGGWGG